MWDVNFSIHHAIESYRILTSVITFRSDILVLCPQYCPFETQCVCIVTGQLPSEGVDVTISAVNCNNLEGPNNTITLLPKGISPQGAGAS